MAAHAATIFTRVLSVTDPVTFLRDAKSCLGAPGIDCIMGFRFTYGLDYSDLYDACNAGDAVKARKVMEAMLAVIDPVMREYGSMEDFTSAKHDYWKPHTPWARSRYAKFHTTDFPHAKVGKGAPYTDRGQARYTAIAAGNA